MKEVMIVFSIIALVVTCIVFDQYTTEERKVILSKFGVKIPVENNQPKNTNRPIDYKNQTDSDMPVLTPSGNTGSPSYVPVSGDGVVYYCTKNGKKIVSDKPCINHDADEEKRKFYAYSETLVDSKDASRRVK